MGIIFFIKRHGEFHGMCSEICGVLHGFTPYTLNDSQYRACTGLGGSPESNAQIVEFNYKI